MSSPQEIADALGTLGISKAVLPIPLLPDDCEAHQRQCAKPWSGGRGRRLDMWKRMGAMLNERAAALSPWHRAGLSQPQYGIPPAGGTTGWAVLLGELDPKLVFLELDLGWVTAGGLDPAAELRRLKGRVKMVHLKDVKPTTKTNYALRRTPAKWAWQAQLARHPARLRRAGVNTSSNRKRPSRDRFESMKISHDYLASWRLGHRRA
jgi:sugar phosphate isomerase/epimerase